MRKPPTPRKPWLLTVTLAAVAALGGGSLALATAGPASAAGPAFPAHYSAPYLQISSSDAGDMAADMAASGDKYYTLAFLNSQSGCTPDWEDGGYSLGTFNSQIAAIQNAGGNVIISSGGAGATELAQTCTNVSQLTAAYQNIVNTTGSNRLDFDIEDSALADTAATTRRDQALAALQAEDPAVQVDFTLGIGATTGLAGRPEYALLQDAKANGVKVSIVDIMTMDFGSTANELADAESGAEATAGDLASLYGISTSAAYAMMGLTPIAGVNDDGSDFSISNAQSLESFAAAHGIAQLSFWEVDAYDKGTGYQYSSIFNQITGGTTTPPPPPVEGPYGGTAAAIPGTVQAANYDTGGQGVAYNVASVNGSGNSYRSDGVDLETCTDTGCGDDIGWTASGQWFKYTVNVATAGTYTVSLRLAAPSAVTDGLHIASSSGANLSGNINVPATGGYQTWTTVTANVTLPAGQQTLTIDQDNGGWNIHQLTFASSGTGTPPPPPGEAPYGGTAAAIPGTVRASNYDTGGQGVAYNVTSTNGTANTYRSDGVDLETCTDTGCGDDIGWTASGQWFKYTVNVATAGTYTVSLRLAAPSAVTDGLHIASSSGANLSGNINVPATGGWQTWTTVTATVTLPTGQQTLTVNQDNGGWNIYTLAFASSGTSTPPPPGTTAWAVGVSYSVGQLVTYQGHTYKCLQANTSQVGWDPVSAPALWQLVS